MEFIGTVMDGMVTMTVGFFCLMGLLVAGAVLFGKRVETKWEYEVDFRDERRREIGEFEVELSRVIEDPKAAVQPDFEIQAKFVLRHPALTVAEKLRVSLEDEVVFEAVVKEEGRIRLRESDLVGEIKDPAVGQIVTVEVGGTELFSEPLRLD